MGVFATEYKRWKRESQVQRFHRKYGHNNQRKFKMQKDPNPKHPEIQDTMRKPNLWIIGVDENEDFQLKGPANIFNKII